MTNTINIAISGIRAAELLIQTSARNIANVSSTSTIQDGEAVSSPYTPQDVIQIPQTTGGTLAYQVDSGKEPVSVYDPDNINADDTGFTSYPNINPAEELAKIQEQSYIYKSNLKLISGYSELLGSMLDISV